jgi:hypothetical protein
MLDKPEPKKYNIEKLLDQELPTEPKDIKA